MAEEEKEAAEGKPEGKKSTNTLVIIVAVVIGLVLIGTAASRLMGLAGRKVAEQAMEGAIERSADGAANVDISREGEEITIETEEGTFTAGTSELPENFPQDISIYPGSTIVTTGSSSEVVTATFETGDSLEAVTGFYTDGLPSWGWEITQTSSLENAAVISFTRSEVDGVIAISETEEGSSFTVSVDLGVDSNE